MPANRSTTSPSSTRTGVQFGDLSIGPTHAVEAVEEYVAVVGEPDVPAIPFGDDAMQSDFSGLAMPEEIIAAQGLTNSGESLGQITDEPVEPQPDLIFGDLLEHASSDQESFVPQEEKSIDAKGTMDFDQDAAAASATGQITIGTAGATGSTGGGGGTTGGEGPLPSHAGDLDYLLDEMLFEDSRKWEVNAADGYVDIRYVFPDFPHQVSDYWRQVDGIETITDGWKHFDNFNGWQRAAAREAMDRWEDLVKVRFVEVEAGEDADLYIYGYTPEKDESWGATSNSVIEDGFIVSNRVRVNTEGGSWTDTAIGQSLARLMMHELGHTLGLAHAGDYDGAGFTYEDDAAYIEDTTMYSIMSYFSGTNSGADYPGLETDIVTPRSHDMLVLQNIYDVNWETRDGDTTYGYNASGVSDVYDFDFNPTLVLTIWDGGGEDTLDLSGDGTGVTLDLNPGAFSSTHGMTYNISLAYLPDEILAGYNALIENAVGGWGNDTLIGNDGDNILQGGPAHDYLFGGNGADMLYGGTGADTMSGGHGIDMFFGSTGIDTVDYSYSIADWTIDLGDVWDDVVKNQAWGTATTGGDDEYLFDIENLVMGDGDDHVTGSSFDNDIKGGDGTNWIYGMGGDDTLQGGADTDWIFGGEDVDTVTGAAGADRLYGGDDDDTLIGGDGEDRLYGGNDDDHLFGGDDNDRLYGGYGVDTLFGYGGDDLIYGSYGGDDLYGGSDDDTLYGGDGGDFLAGGTENDWLSGGADNDVLNGGPGSDTADYTYSDEDWTVILALGTASVFNGESDTLAAIENLRMGGGDDLIFGDGNDNALESGDGNDTVYGGSGSDGLYGGGGDDFLNGGAGQDYLIGGTGFDTASYANAPGSIVIDLSIAGLQNTVSAGMDGLSQIESIEGSDHADWLYGNDQTNWLYGEDGDDTLSGRDGVDWLFGGEGNDFLIGGAGNDLHYGGAGSDTASYYDAPSGVWVNLNLAGWQNTLGGGTDWLSDIENIYGSAYNDILTGDGNHNWLYGGSGNDALTGGGANDHLFGGAGNDQLFGGEGDDALYGGSGSDWANYSIGLTTGVSVSLNLVTQYTVGGGVDSLFDIENLHGTGFDDSLYGDGAANHLVGDGGVDWLFGGGGNDILNGGNENDVLFGSSGNDDLIGGAGNDSMAGGSGYDDFIFEGAWGQDVVTDFNVNSDDLDFSDIGGLNTIAQLSLTDTYLGVVVAFGGNSVRLNGVSSWELNDGNFII